MFFQLVKEKRCLEHQIFVLRWWFSLLATKRKFSINLLGVKDIYFHNKNFYLTKATTK